MDAAQSAREARKQKLLTELTEIMIEEQKEEGVFLETPHFSVIERAAITLGRQLSLQARERGAREVAAGCPPEVPCPTCQSACRSETKTRDVLSPDGEFPMTDATAYCHKCRRSFFPSAG